MAMLGPLNSAANHINRGTRQLDFVFLITVVQTCNLQYFICSIMLMTNRIENERAIEVIYTDRYNWTQILCI